MIFDFFLSPATLDDCFGMTAACSSNCNRKRWYSTPKQGKTKVMFKYDMILVVHLWNDCFGTNMFYQLCKYILEKHTPWPQGPLAFFGSVHSQLQRGVCSNDGGDNRSSGSREVKALFVLTDNGPSQIEQTKSQGRNSCHPFSKTKLLMATGCPRGPMTHIYSCSNQFSSCIATSGRWVPLSKIYQNLWKSRETRSALVESQPVSFLKDLRYRGKQEAPEDSARPVFCMFTVVHHGKRRSAWFPYVPWFNHKEGILLGWKKCIALISLGWVDSFQQFI